MVFLRSQSSGSLSKSLSNKDGERKEHFLGEPNFTETLKNDEGISFLVDFFKESYVRREGLRKSYVLLRGRGGV